MLSSPGCGKLQNRNMWQPHLAGSSGAILLVVGCPAPASLQDPQEVVEQVQRIQQLMQEEVNALPGPCAAGWLVEQHKVIIIHDRICCPRGGPWLTFPWLLNLVRSIAVNLQIGWSQVADLIIWIFHTTTVMFTCLSSG